MAFSAVVWQYVASMAAPKATFSLDHETLERLKLTAERLGRPKSEVVRLAILDYSERVGRLSERERLQKLKAFDELVPRIPSTSVRQVEAEIDDIRRVRRGGGRRSLARKKA